jgi:hypothetical protein
VSEPLPISTVSCHKAFFRQFTYVCLSALLEGVAAGALTPAEAGEVAKLVEVHRRTVETVELEERLRRLEAGQKP